MFIHIGVKQSEADKMILDTLYQLQKFENNQLTKWSIFGLGDSAQCFMYLAKAKTIVNIFNHWNAFNSVQQNTY